MSLASKILKKELLFQRANYLKKTRKFFDERGYLEVDLPCILKKPSLDTHVEVMEVSISDRERGYLHTSFEYFMKRLLSEGFDKIYQMGHVFRKNELGKLHNPEFTMIEWYQKGAKYTDFIEEVLHFLMSFFESGQVNYFTYKQIFEKFLSIDPFKATVHELNRLLEKFSIQTNTFLDKPELLHLLLSCVIEPQFNNFDWVVVDCFPEDQAALAKTCKIEENICAKRFEIYYKSLEIANGYDELNNATVLRMRLEKENNRRISQNKPAYSIDENLLKAVENMTDCMGVSVGFDRLFMLCMKEESLHNVLPFSWQDF